jgi:hypothetical protein
MAENTYKKNTSEKTNTSFSTKTKKYNFLEAIRNFFIFSKKTESSNSPEQILPPKYIPYIIFWAILGMIYISNAHQAEKAVRQTTKLEAEVENLRADYITLKSSYDAFAGKQSEIVKSADTLGLVNDKEKVKRLILKKEQQTKK